MLGIVVVGADALALSPLLIDIAASFHTPVETAGLLVAAYGLALATTAPLVALKFQDRPRRTLMLAGLTLLALAAACCAFATWFGVLLVGRTLCGVAAGLFIPACYAWVGDNVPYEVRGRVMGRVMAGWSIALICGIPAGAWIAEAFSWRATFLAVSFLAAAAAVFVLRMSEQRPSEQGQVSISGLLRITLSADVVKLLSINFLDMLSFYGCYTFLGTAVRRELGVGSGVFGGLVLFYGLGLLCSSLNAAVLDKVGKAAALRAALMLLAPLFLVMPWGLSSTLSVAVLMTLWGLLQGAIQTSSATLMTQRAATGRGIGLALMSSTTYLAVAIGSSLGGRLMTAYDFGALAVMAFAALLLASLIALTIADSAVGSTVRPGGRPAD
ncbi:MFS transporter [Rhodopseudomonas infernalis]|uniref:MFS transporter n=1 Tax=Rhodopseudomonas infernalis TaxID=2897386 RepID=UPI001EE8B119|nr:MFS transporter [Rhodopseudomonas infernalis]